MTYVVVARPSERLVQGKHRTRALGGPETDNTTHLIQCLSFTKNMPFFGLGCNTIYVVKHFEQIKNIFLKNFLQGARKILNSCWRPDCSPYQNNNLLKDYKPHLQYFISKNSGSCLIFNLSIC